MWAAIGLTCKPGTSCVYQKELDVLKRKGLFCDVPVLAIEDSSSCMGSGGSSLNAAVVLIEHLSARAGYSVLNPEMVTKSRLLIINSGRELRYDETGFAFIDFNAVFISPSGVEIDVNNFVHIYLSITRLVFGSSKCINTCDIPFGIWLCGSNSCTIFNPHERIDWKKFTDSGCGLMALSFPIDFHSASDHGIYELNNEDVLSDIIYQGNFDEFQACKRYSEEKAPLALAYVFFSSKVAEEFIRLHTVYPLTFATYLGEDSSCSGFKLSLFFDFILATCVSVDEKEFVHNCRAISASKGMPGLRRRPSDHCEDRINFKDFLLKGRKNIYDAFTKFRTKVVSLDVVYHNYFIDDEENYFRFSEEIAKYLTTCDYYKVIRNDSFPSICVAQNSFQKHQNGYCSDIPVTKCYNPLSESISILRLQKKEIDAIEQSFKFKKDEASIKRLRIIEDILKNNSPTYLIPKFKCLCVDNYSGQLLNLLDKTAISLFKENYLAVARILYCISDVLYILSENKGGIRSGPGLHPEWACFMRQLENNNYRNVVESMKTVRERWMNTTFRLVRAARHYESAGQCLIRQHLKNVKNFINLRPYTIGNPIQFGRFYAVEATARMDFCGAWSDTPPVTNEIGGCVISASITVDDQRPVGAKTKRIRKPHIVVHSGCETSFTLCVHSDLQRYDDPSNPSAFISAILLCADVVRFDNEKLLNEDLMERWGGGFEIHYWSKLPQGSGLGTSSILAGCILKSIYDCIGLNCDIGTILHAVLYVEQLLTTGGGWQDQVGGLCDGGIKMGRLVDDRIAFDLIPLSDKNKQYLNDHLLLLYTGKTRLAKNLLQEVIRNWFSKEPSIVATFFELMRNAENCANALENGNWKMLAETTRMCAVQKAVVAPGSLADSTSTLIECLYSRNLIRSCWPAGAGGGGYVYLFLSEPSSKDAVEDILSSKEAWKNMSVNAASIVTNAMVCSVE